MRERFGRGVTRGWRGKRQRLRTEQKWPQFVKRWATLSGASGFSNLLSVPSLEVAAVGIPFTPATAYLSHSPGSFGA